MCSSDLPLRLPYDVNRPCIPPQMRLIRQHDLRPIFALCHLNRRIWSLDQNGCQTRIPSDQMDLVWEFHDLDLPCQQNSPRLNKMPTTIRDSSLTTARRRQLALYAWRQANQFPQNPQSVRPEQGGSKGGPDSGPTATVPVNAYLGAQLIGQTTGGACACSPAVSLQGYDKKSPAC